MYRILVINPGSTSTKVAVYEDERAVFLKNVAHSDAEIAAFADVIDQLAFRERVILQTLADNDVRFDFDAVIGRGGLVKHIPGGVYAVNERLCHDSVHALRKHPCNLGVLLARDLAARLPACRTLTADPTVVDEERPEAKVSGLPEMEHAPIWHALNQKAVARRYAREVGRAYEDLRLIVCHMGGGISIAVHEGGRTIDVNNALDGRGPFSPGRAGSLPVGDLIHLCFSGKYTEEELVKYVTGRSGLYAHLGTTDVREILRRIAAGDDHARLVVDAMVYQIAKKIAAEGAVLRGKVDAIVLTGGLAYADYIVEGVRRRVEFLAPVAVYAGEDEMEALAQNALAVLQGVREAQEYV